MGPEKFDEIEFDQAWWDQYVDPQGVISENEFKNMGTAKKQNILIELKFMDKNGKLLNP